MAAKKETKTETVEREYVIPLREKCRSAVSYKKTPKAVKTVKEFLVRHMKIRDRDLRKIRLDKFVNETLWARGIKSPPHKIKIKAIKDGDIVRVELAEVSKKFMDKKARLEKREAKVESGKKKPVSLEKSGDSIKKEEKVSGKNDKDGVDDKVDTLKGTSEVEKEKAGEETLQEELKSEKVAKKVTPKDKEIKESKTQKVGSA